MRLSTSLVSLTAVSSLAQSSAFAPSRHTSHAVLRSFNTKSPTSLSVIDTNEYAQRNVPAFEEWATNCGVQRMEGLQLYSEDGSDYQVFTTVDIPAGTTVLYVPSGMILRASYVAPELKSISNGGVQAAIDGLVRLGGGAYTDDFYLFIKLLVEYEQQENSGFYPYLDMLPRLYFNAVSMTDFCLECLPPLVFSLSRDKRVRFDNLCQCLQKVDIVSDQLKQNKDVLRWAFNAVLTRAIYNKEGQGDDAAIVPMCDMFNHGSETEIEFAFDGEGNCMAYTTVDVAANSPLRVSYGSPTNPSFLFARYGFMDDSCPATFCKIMDIPKTPDNVDVGLDPTKMLFYHDTGDISEEVLDVVLYAKVLGNVKYHPDAPTFKNQFYQAHMSGDVATKQAIHEQFRYETLGEIKKHVDSFLKNLDDLAEKSDGKSFDEHPRLPLILAHNEFVRQTFQNVKTNLDAFVGDNEQSGSDQWGQDDGQWVQDAGHWGQDDGQWGHEEGQWGQDSGQWGQEEQWA